MDSDAGFVVAIPFRCHSPALNRPGEVCGEVAAFERKGQAGELPEFFCEAHRTTDDKRIQLDARHRRCRIFAEITIGGIGKQRGAALNEATDRLMEAVQSVGGVFCVMQEHEAIGRRAPSPFHDKANTARRRGK